MGTSKNSAPDPHLATATKSGSGRRARDAETAERASPPIMGLMMVMASSRKVMGQFVLPNYLKIFGRLATLIMALAALGMLWPSAK